MKERPILFSDPMVVAILSGQKTQTRRIVNPRLLNDTAAKCPYGGAGDRLWVRESHYVIGETGDVFYRASDGRCERGGLPAWPGPWKPSIHMRRSASRITLEIVRMGADLLQDISDSDAVAEGIVHWEGHGYYDRAPDAGGQWHVCARDAYRTLWESINGVGSWAANPWVWVVEFRRIK